MAAHSFSSCFVLLQFLLYIDSTGLGSPMDMETDGPLLDDVQMLKKTVEEEATQVRDPMLGCQYECTLCL